MKYKVVAIILLACVLIPQSYALERPDVEFKIFRFPANMIPRIDGDTDDWDLVPDSYAIGTDQLSDTVKGRGTDIDRKDYDVTVRVGWVKGLNRIYFLYEAYDDYWNMTYTRGDIFELTVDADLSGVADQVTGRYGPQRGTVAAALELVGFHVENLAQNRQYVVCR